MLAAEGEADFAVRPKAMAVQEVPALIMEQPKPSTTTLSTIVLQRRTTRIVVALLKCADRLNIKLLEMEPELGDLGRNFEDALQLQTSMHEVMQELHSKQSPVEELLRQADELIINQKPKAGVYSAMAESLGAAWMDLHEVLGQRRAIVDKNFLFQGHLQDFSGKVLELEEMIIKGRRQSYKNPTEMMHEYSVQRRRILEAAIFSLQEGDALLTILHGAWSQTCPDFTPKERRASLSRAIETVELWLETIHDKRTRITKLFQEVTQEFQMQSKLYQLETLMEEKLGQILDVGRDLGQVDKALAQHHKIHTTEIALLKELTSSNEKVARWENILHQRLDLLEKAKAFFVAAESNIANLHDVEKALSDCPVSHYETTNAQLDAFQVSAEQIADEMSKKATQIQLASIPCETSGVQLCLRAILDKVDLIKSTVSLKRKQIQRSSSTLRNFKTQIDDVKDWLGAQDLDNDVHLGKNVPQVTAFMNKTKDALCSFQRKSNELEGMIGALKIIAEQDEQEKWTEDVDMKNVLQHMCVVSTCLNQRIDLASAYVKFLKLTDELLQEMELFQKELGQAQSSTSPSIETRRQTIQQLYLQACNLSKKCIALLEEKTQTRVNVMSLKADIEKVMRLIDTKQNKLFNSWKSSQERSNEAKRKDKEGIDQAQALLSGLQCAWKFFDPFIRVHSEPGFIVSSLEDSYIQIAKVREIVHSLESIKSSKPNLPKDIKQSIDKGIMTINALETLFQTLITFTKHLAALKLGTREELKKSDFQSKDLMESERLAKEHEVLKKTTLEKFVDVEREAEMVSEKIRNFEQLYEDIKVLQRGGGDLSFERLIEDMKSEFLREWNDGKAKITKQAQRRILHAKNMRQLQQELDFYRQKIEAIYNGVFDENDAKEGKSFTQDMLSSVLPRLKAKLQSLREEEEEACPTNLLQSEEKMHQLEQSIKALTEKLRHISLYFEALHSAQDLIGRTSKKIEDQVGKVSTDNLDTSSIETMLKDLTESFESQVARLSKLLSDIRGSIEVHHVEEVRREYNQTVTSVQQVISKLKERPPPRPPPPTPVCPYFELKLRDIVLQEGEGCEMVAKVRGEPFPQITWFKDGVPVTGNSDYQTDVNEESGECRLKIAETLTADSSNWSIRASNIGGYAESHSKLTIKESPASKSHNNAILTTPPAFYVPLKNQECFEGKVVIIEAVIISTPPPHEARWYHNGDLIQNTKETEILHHGDVYQLILKDVGLNQAGEYKIIATNSVGSSQSAASLTVKSAQPQGKKARIVSGLVGVSADKGDFVTLTALIEADPKASVSWIKDGAIISPTDKAYSIRERDNTYSLTINCLQESAMFEIRVSNHLGSDVSRANVEMRPGRLASTSRCLPDSGLESANGSWSSSHQTIFSSSTTHRKRAENLGTVPRPSKFQKGEMYHSDYESDWDASPIRPKWRPCHSDTEDLVPTMRYRPVKPKLKQSSPKKDQQPRPPSPPGPHQWESHEAIESLEKSLRRHNLTSAQDRKVFVQAHKISQSMERIEHLYQQRRSSSQFVPAASMVKVARAASVGPLPARCQSTPIEIEASSSSNKKFVSVRTKAKLLEDIMLLHQKQSSPEDDKETSERSTPIKPEDIPGAVRVLPPPTLGSLDAKRGHRSASVDMNGYHRSSPTVTHSTLPRTNRPSSSSTCQASLETRESSEAALTSSLSRKFQEAITRCESSTTVTTTTIVRGGSNASEEEKRKNLFNCLQEMQTSSTIKQSCGTAMPGNDVPPTIELTAYKCDTTSGGGDDDDGKKDAVVSSTPDGYEADTDDTLRRRSAKGFTFKPSKFVPGRPNGSVPIWKPSLSSST